MKEGLENMPHEGGKNFVNIKDGELVSGPKNDKKSYTHLTGRITSLDISDEEYEGRAYKKIKLQVEAGEEVYFLGFPLESGYGTAFASLSPNIDFSLPVSISAGIEKIEGTQKKYGKLFIKQPAEGDKWVNLKWYFTKESTEVPRGVEKSDRNGKFLDFTDRNNFFYSLLCTRILEAITRGVKAADQKKVAKKKNEPALPVDDLPF